MRNSTYARTCSYFIQHSATAAPLALVAPFCPNWLSVRLPHLVSSQPVGVAVSVKPAAVAAVAAFATAVMLYRAVPLCGDWMTGNVGAFAPLK